MMDSNPNPYSTKTIKSALIEFKKKALTNIKAISDLPNKIVASQISIGDARKMALLDETVDLIVTSPPYASNAIDYMRAHKFALVWFGNQISTLSKTRGEYIGSETLTRYDKFKHLPPTTNDIITTLTKIDPKKGMVVSKYYQESIEILSEMYRVLKPGKTMIYVVGTSIIKGIYIRIADCLAELGTEVGFSIPKIAIRSIDRDKRMMPISRNKNNDSIIEQRMHNEFVIGFYKGG